MTVKETQRLVVEDDWNKTGTRYTLVINGMELRNVFNSEKEVIAKAVELIKAGNDVNIREVDITVRQTTFNVELEKTALVE